MNKVLSKRIPREFKSNLPKYIALLLLIVLCMYLVTAMVASSETIIIRTDEHNAANHVEDGQFTTFLPLTDEQEKDITDKGVTLERMYSLDIKAEDGSTLRVMKNRKNIDLVELIRGEYPSKDNEAVVERRYTEEHSLDVGSKLTVGGTEYTVCGIGTSPDYDAPYQNMSDMAVSSKNFGIIFVTDSEYERVSDSSKSAQTFTYGYLLGNDMTDDELKELIEDFDFDYTKVTDKYYLETVNEALEKRTEIENGINDLAEGADKLHNGLKDLSDGADTLYLVIYAVVIPPVIAAIVNALVINRRLSAPALSLMRNEQNVRNISRMEIKSGGFVRKFRIRQLLREMRANITVAACMFVSMLILMLGLDCYSMCNNVTTDMLAGTTYEYMYTLKYPTTEVPDGGEACYVKSLEKEKDGYTLDITVIGIDSDNPYYNVDVKKGKSIVTASLSVAQRYGVAEGDKFILTDEAAGTDYAFTVDSISDYSAGLAVFMDIDSMRELFRQDDDYYNMVLSDKPLDIDEGRIYSVTTKSDIERSSKVFSELMSGMVITLVGTSAVIFVVVMYLMMGVMIDRSSFGISLLKTFGYSKKDVKKLYLDGNAITIAISAIICLPLSKLVMDRIYPSFIPNVACGINLNFAWYLYPALFIAVMLIYLLTSTLLVRKLNRITPAEVLKNRE